MTEDHKFACSQWNKKLCSTVDKAKKAERKRGSTLKEKAYTKRAKQAEKSRYSNESETMSFFT